MNKYIKKAIKNADKCNSLFSKIKGFMFSFSRKPKLFIFNKEQQVRIHTFFCFFPLEIIFFNNNWNIVKKETVKPFKILKSCKAQYILEIPHWK
jgi:uncharacterized membrane protein (UPF0127 family)